MSTCPDPDKPALRRAVLARRAAVPAGTRALFAQRLVAVGLDLVARTGATCVAGFWPIRDEPDCRPLLAALAERGIRTALPVVDADRRELAFRLWRAGDPLETLRFGLSEPTTACPPAEPDLLLVPCAAFDRAGHRIGYGRGHYDATLAWLRQRRSVVAAAIAFATQEVAAVPGEAHDERIDLIVTEFDVIAVSPITPVPIA